MIRTDACGESQPRFGRAFQEIMLYKLPQNILNILHEAVWNVAQPRICACDCTGRCDGLRCQSPLLWTGAAPDTLHVSCCNAHAQDLP